MIVAVGTLLKAYREYASQGQQRRAELFFSLRGRLREPHLSRIAELIDVATLDGHSEAVNAEEELSHVPLREKREYVGLFEEVAVFMADGQIEPDLAEYMFGYYALLCQECIAFWNNINYDSVYWSIFHDFCVTMRARRAVRVASQAADGDDGTVLELD